MTNKKPEPKKNILTVEITFDLDYMAGMSAPERKNSVENAFNANKEQTLDAITKRLS